MYLKMSRGLEGAWYPEPVDDARRLREAGPGLTPRPESFLRVYPKCTFNDHA